jgi:phage tail-like protein
MALSPQEIKTQYPLPVYNYKVSIDGETIAFSQVTGLSMSFETSTYKESPTEDGIVGPVIMRMPGQPADVTLTLQKGIVRGKSLPVLYNWINSKQLNLIQKKDIQVDLCDENGASVFRWTVRNAFPTKLDAPGFEATSNDAAIESMELMADSIAMEEL